MRIDATYKMTEKNIFYKKSIYPCVGTWQVDMRTWAVWKYFWFHKKNRPKNGPEK